MKRGLGRRRELIFLLEIALQSLLLMLARRGRIFFSGEKKVKRERSKKRFMSGRKQAKFSVSINMQSN